MFMVRQDGMSDTKKIILFDLKGSFKNLRIYDTNEGKF